MALAAAAGAGGAAGGADGAGAGGFEDLLDLAKMALPDLSKDVDGKAAALVMVCREYLRGVTPDRREAPLLAAARHALVCSRESGRPSLGAYACKTIVKTMVPKLLELCHPDWPAYTTVVTPYHDNGLFANVLQVYDALFLSRPDATVLVDWQRKGSEGHFQYGKEGFDLFAHLFRFCDRCHSVAAAPGGRSNGDSAIQMPSRVSPLFLNVLRGYFWTLPEADSARLRRGYAASVRPLEPAPHILAKVQEVCGQWDPGVRVVGVHKRLGTPEVTACQLSQRAPSPAEFAARARAILAEEGAGAAGVVFLATDDALAAAAFEEAFAAGSGPGAAVRLCCRAGVRRTEGGVRADGVDNEVHRSPCEVEDAEDALVDALCLARCDDLVCIDSNLSIFAAITNPELRVHPLNSLLPEGWEAAADRPAEAVFSAYEVTWSPCVFVRAGPSAASLLLGAKKKGEVVTTTGRGFDGWVELTEGGWVLVDGERQAQGRGMGKLLEPAGPAHGRHGDGEAGER